METAPVSQSPVRVRSVAIPSEHGGWSLTLEPVVLGMIVAASGAGFALGVAALASFLARTPLKLALGDRWRRRRMARTVLAERFAFAYAAVAVLALVVAVVTAKESFLLPLVVATPLVVIGLSFDVRSRSRRLVAELAGTIGIGSVAAAIVLAGGGGRHAALAAWSVVALRSVAAIPFVRTQLVRAKHPGRGSGSSDVAQVLAVVGASAGWVFEVLPGLAAATVIAMALVHLVLARARPPKAPVIGAQQVVLGLTLVVVSGLALIAP